MEQKTLAELQADLRRLQMRDKIYPSDNLKRKMERLKDEIWIIRKCNSWANHLAR